MISFYTTPHCKNAQNVFFSPNVKLTILGEFLYNATSLVYKFIYESINYDN